MIELDLHSGFPNSPDEFDYENLTFNTVTHSIRYIDFFDQFMRKNLPCLIQGISDNWECARKWVNNNSIDCDYFTNTYGDLEAPVADCKNVAYNAHCKSTMRVSSYMEYLKHNNEQLLYLKDWHLRRLQPNDNFYEIPMVFASDWLNEFCQDHQEDDFMFVYIGPKNSWTPLHADVYSSFSWSVNVVGRKQWILFPPGEEAKLKDKLGNLPMIFDSKSYSDVKYFEIVQEKGDAIFVPSGWFHQVTNIVDTISINHNWINGCNIIKVWHALESNLISVEHEIQEFKQSDDFTLQCQLILKSVFGMDFEMFVKFICHISEKRIKQLHKKHSLSTKEFTKYPLGINHLKFDLNSILQVINLIIQHTLFTNAKVLPIKLQNKIIAVKDIIMKICDE